MSESEKVNRDLANEKPVNPSPCSQRKPRLNRRGLHLSNHPFAKLFSEKSDQQKSNINGGNDGSEIQDKVDLSQRKIISLTTVKNSTSEKNSAKGSCNNGSEIQNKVDLSQRRIISLKTVKNSTSEKNSAEGKDASSIVILKKNSCSTSMSNRKNAVATKTSSSCDPPPKKKHKPITWP